MPDQAKKTLIWCSEAKTIRELRDGESIVSSRSPLDSCIIAPIIGDNDYFTRLHYEIRLSTNLDLSDEIIYRSDDPNTITAWQILSSENGIKSFPETGVEAWYEWKTDDYMQRYRAPRGEVGSSILFNPQAIGLCGKYLFRIRAWDIYEVGDGETPVSEPGLWRYGISSC